MAGDPINTAVWGEADVYIAPLATANPATNVAFSTIADAVQPDGTIARLPASHELWYPSPEALAALVRQAGMVVELSYGSHDLEPLARVSERRIFVVAYEPTMSATHEVRVG